MQRTFSAALLNDVANRRNVRPLLGGEGPIDLTPVVEHPANFAFINDVGGFVYQRLFDGLYEVHTLFDPSDAIKRGSMLPKAARATVNRMFIHTDAVELRTKTLPGADGASWLANHAGFQGMYVQNNVSYWNLHLDAWARSCSTHEDRGRAFHEQLEAAKDAVGSKLPVHPLDAVHDRMVGAAIAMVQAGNVAKGVDTYNRWAVFAGYAPVTMISANPPVIDVRDAVVEFHNGEMEIALCR